MQHVDAAEVVERSSDRAFDIASVQHVAGERQRCAAFLRDDTGRLVCSLSADVDANDLGSSAGIGHGRCFAVAPARPDRPRPEHERDSISEIAHRTFTPSATALLRTIGYGANHVMAAFRAEGAQADKVGFGPFKGHYPRQPAKSVLNLAWVPAFAGMT